MGTFPYIKFHHLQSGIPKTFPNQGGIGFHGIGKALFGTTKHLFHFHFRNTHAGVSGAGNFHCLVKAIHKEHSISRKYPGEHLLHIRQLFHICNSQTVIFHKFLNLRRRNLPEVPDHFSKCGILQHHIGSRHLNVNHQAVHLALLAEAHPPDLNIPAVLQALPYMLLIYTNVL